MMQFVVFNVMIVASELYTSEEQFAAEVERQNEILLQNLEKQSKNKKLEKRGEVSLLAIVFKNKEKIELFGGFLTAANGLSAASSKNAKELFENVDIHSFEWLSRFFRAKVEVNIKESPQKLSYKLQKTIFQLRY